MNLLRRLNPGLALIETAYGEVAGGNLESARAGTNPALEFAADVHGRPRKNPGRALSSLLYRAYRPFHPQRFWDWFNAEHPGLLRVKGLVWLATRNLLVGGISRTRWQNSCGGAGIWWAALPREEWPAGTGGADADAGNLARALRRPPQELVLIGEAARRCRACAQARACLLERARNSRGPLRGLAALPDPFPGVGRGRGADMTGTCSVLSFPSAGAAGGSALELHLLELAVEHRDWLCCTATVPSVALRMTVKLSVSASTSPRMRSPSLRIASTTRVLRCAVRHGQHAEAGVADERHSGVSAIMSPTIRSPLIRMTSIGSLAICGAAW